jgi:hypothetical protein
LRVIVGLFFCPLLCTALHSSSRNCNKWFSQFSDHSGFFIRTLQPIFTVPSFDISSRWLWCLFFKW